jgi:hypothetical protein
MDARLNFRTALSTQVLLTACCLVLLAGCSDPETNQRAILCKRAGVTGDALKTCTSTDEGYERIMGPIRAQREQEQVAAFNAALQALPSRSIPKGRYETVSLEVLKKNKCCLGDYTDAIEAPKHPLFGKRFVVQGRIAYFPTDLEEKTEEHQWLELRDSTNQKDTWQLEVDLESLSRAERSLIRAHCAFADCVGEFFGVIGRVESRERGST